MAIRRVLEHVLRVVHDEEPARFEHTVQLCELLVESFKRVNAGQVSNFFAWTMCGVRCSTAMQKMASYGPSFAMVFGRDGSNVIRKSAACPRAMARLAGLISTPMRCALAK